MKSRILYTKPSITQLEKDFVLDAMSDGWGANSNKYIEMFELEFKKHLGVEYAISTSSCTGAIHMGLAALGIGVGDEVILADSNWIATAAPIVHLGAIPVFVDILKDTWCLDPHEVEKKITSRTKAIIAVHLYGNLCEMQHLIDIGSRYGIPVIEDAAEALGSIYKGKRAGSIGTFGAFSFHGSKTITTGEGGMFVTNDASLYERVLTLSNHGRSRFEDKQFWPERIGFKYKLSNTQAAMGCAQISRIDELVQRKRDILQKYRIAFCNIDGTSINPEPIDGINGAWMPNIVFADSMNLTRDKIKLRFNEENIDARVFFWPLSSLGFFGGRPSNPRALDIANRAINLPSYHDMTDDEQNRVIKIVQELSDRAPFS